MKTQPGIKLKGSFRAGLDGEALNQTDKDEVIDVTIRLRRKQDLPDEALKGKFLTREIYESDYAALLEDAEKVEAFAHAHLLSTVEVNLARRSIIVKGKISDFEEAFDVILKTHKSKTGNFRVLTSEINIPADLQDIIKGVFGLDNRPIARPMFQVAKKNGKVVSHAEAPQAFTPNQLAGIYGFPTGVNGSGQCIGLIELGGGFRATDITKYFKSLGIAKPTVKAISVDKGKNSPTTASGADGEVMLDIEVAGATAPAALIAVYFAPNTDQGFLDAITQAIHDTQNKPSIISISWGSAELNWTQQAMDNFNEAFKTAAALGITICIAAGDSGSSDGETDGNMLIFRPPARMRWLAAEQPYW